MNDLAGLVLQHISRHRKELINFVSSIGIVRLHMLFVNMSMIYPCMIGAKSFKYFQRILIFCFCSILNACFLKKIIGNVCDQIFSNSATAATTRRGGVPLLRPGPA